MTEPSAMRVAKGSTYLIIQSISTTIISVVAFAFIARILTQTEMGITVVLTLLLTIAQILTDFGFSSGLAKYIAEYRGKNADYGPILYTGVLTKVFMAGFAAVLCSLTSPWLSELLLKSQEYAFLFRLLSIDLLFFCINITVNYILLGLNRIKEMAIVNVIAVSTRQIFAVGLLLHGFGLTGLIGGWLLGDLTLVTLGALIIAKTKNIKMYPIKSIGPYLRMLAKFSWPLLFTSIVMFVYNWFDRALLLAYIPLGEIAVYNVALQAFTVLYVIPGALSNILLPYYSEQYGREKHQHIIAVIRGATRYIALVFTPLALGLAITANPTITLFAGSKYAGGDVILAILSFFGGVGGLGGALSVLLLVYEMTPTVLVVNIVSIAASLVLSPLLLSSLGVMGMAVVKGTAMIISLILTIVFLRRRLPIQFDNEAIWKSWSAAVMMLLVVALITQTGFSQYALPLYILVGGITYVIGLRLLKTLNKNDIQLIRNLMGRRVPSIMNILEKILT